MLQEKESRPVASQRVAPLTYCLSSELTITTEGPIEVNARVFAASHTAAPAPPRGSRYGELLRVPALSAGWYVLPAGATDEQSPHGEDEIYYVVRGRARVRLGADDRPVEPGAVVYVPAGVEHRFHSIAEELVLLVVFAPAEGTAPRPC